ncbi:MAG: HipA domain-containing protein [Bifidobacteriaceae bacterium]|jgi:serine/threonine-protein kinase HipA|nr:HipA domain-containing protein [Bifidobacteriaceae bacterium]
MASVTWLDAWLYGTRVARLERDGDSRIHWEWTPETTARWGGGSRVVSNFFPLGDPVHPLKPKVFLDGYLPEAGTRTSHAINAGVAPADTFGLIAAYGRDLAGALILVPEGETAEPPNPSYRPLATADVAERLRQAGRRTGHDSFSSLPGLVPKILLHRDGNQWYAPQGGAPSTWIIKRGHDQASPATDVIDTEVLCLRIARRLGLTNVDAEIIDFGDRLRGIAVRRYDRAVRANGGIARLHQEDLAQAIGLNTDDPHRKIQRGAARMPSLAHAAEVLIANGVEPDNLLRLTGFSHLVGNTDLHAKNLSYVHTATGRTALAPAYDIAMHLHLPRSTGEVALLVNGKARFNDIGWDDLVAEAESWGIPRDRANSLLVSLGEQFADALQAEHAPGNHPGVPDSAWNTAAKRVTAFLRQRPALAL